MTALMKPLGEQRSVPLHALELSADNVRGVDAEDPALPQLQASIAALGVLTPLVVVPVPAKAGRPPKNPVERFAVIAGGRRLRALRNLANALEIGEHYAVPCVVREASDGVTEISLAENVLRAALKPHEEYAAFAKMAAEGMDAGAIAGHFGTSERRVGQLLRLGNLAAPVLEAFASGVIGLAVAQVYAGTSDTELQAKVFAALTKTSGHYPHEIRRAIRGDGGDLTGKLRAVGLDAYTAAGGRFDADLFGAAELEGRVLDPDILEPLFLAKEAEALAALAAAMPEVALVEGVHWNTGQKVDVERAPLDGVLALEGKRLATEIAAKREALAALCDEDGDLIDEANEAQAEQLNDEIDVLQDKIEALCEQAPMVLPAPADGCKFVASPGFIAREGRWATTAVMMVPEAWTPDNPIQIEKGSTSTGSVRTGLGVGAAEAAPTSGPAFMKAEYGLSADSIEVMRAQRLMILQAKMIDDAATSRDFLTFVTIRGIDGGDYAGALGVVARASSDHFASDRPEISGQPGFRYVSNRTEAMERAWLIERDPVTAWGMFLALVDEERTHWGGYAATLLLARSLNAPGYGCPLHDALAAALGVQRPIRDHWTPDAAFWARLSKKHRLAALKAIDPELAAVSKALDKDMLLERCVGVFSGDQAMIAKLIPEGRAAQATIAASKWVPEYLTFRDMTPVDVTAVEFVGQEPSPQPSPRTGEGEVVCEAAE